MIRKLKYFATVAVASAIVMAIAPAPDANAALSCYWGTVKVPPCTYTQMTPFFVARKNSYVVSRTYNFGVSQTNDSFLLGFKRPSSTSQVSFYGTERGYQNPFPGSASDPFLTENGGVSPFTAAYYEY